MNPLSGVFLHAVGGLAAGSFYAPLRKIERWNWETGWLVANFVAYLAAPLAIAFCTIPHFADLLAAADSQTLAQVFFFGFLWGIGGLTFGLALRWLGMSLGMAVVLGLCTVLGTLVPPIFKGTLGELVGNASNLVSLLGMPLCLLGIALCGYAGMRKEAELTAEQKQEGVKEFHLGKGFLAALVSGVMSSFCNFGIEAGAPIAELARQQFDVPDIWKNTAAVVPLMIGNFVANLAACLILNAVHRSWGDYRRGPAKQLALYYFLAVLAGAVGAQEFFWFGMGKTKMGRYDFASWPIHLAFVIFFSNLWGLYYREWKGVGRRTWSYVWCGLAALILSTVVSGPVAYLFSRQADSPSTPSSAAITEH
ncbi:MAG: L-rhamnose/proton symporter RhaT [Pirellulales bacterium]|nr:L-rhamnose/proton symporter RhaT [Pirellulales bacterium]